MNHNRITRREARVLAEEEFVRFADLVESLTPDEWARPTDCTGWDVRMIALHVLGSADAQASVEGVRPPVPARHATQQTDRLAPLGRRPQRVADPRTRHLSNDELVAQLHAVGPKAVKGRWRTPPPARYLPIPFGPPIGWAPLKYLLDVGFTRDVWAHRIDIHAAIDRPMRLTADHDGRLVADIVAEWATIHAQPFELVLDGPAGGKFTHGVDGERIEIDAVEFIRTLSGRLQEPVSSTTRYHSEGDTPMETRIDEIADRIFRLSTFVPDIGPTGFTFNQFLIDAEEPAIFHTGPRRHVPVGVRGRRHGAAARAAALDHVRSPRSRRVRGDEPVPRRRTERPGGPHRARVHGVDQRPRRPTPGTDHSRQHLRPRRPAHPQHRHAPRAPRLGRPRDLRRDHRHTVLRRPPFPRR